MPLAHPSKSVAGMHYYISFHIIMFYIMLWISFTIITHANYTLGFFPIGTKEYENTVFKMPKIYP